MFIIYDVDCDEFLSNNSPECAEFYLLSEGNGNLFDEGGRIVEYGTIKAGRKLDPVKDFFASQKEARAFAEKLAEKLLGDGAPSVEFHICSIEVEDEITLRGGKLIKSRQFATVTHLDSVTKEKSHEDDKTTEVEKVIGDLILENYRPHFDLETDEHLAARKIINALSEMGYKITKQVDYE